MIVWSSEKRKISELVPAKYNPRKMSDKDKEDITQSAVDGWEFGRDDLH